MHCQMLSGRCSIPTRPLLRTAGPCRRQSQHVAMARSGGTSGRGRGRSGRKGAGRAGETTDSDDNGEPPQPAASTPATEAADAAEQDAAARREALGQQQREAQAAKLAQQAAARRGESGGSENTSTPAPGTPAVAEQAVRRESEASETSSTPATGAAAATEEEAAARRVALGREQREAQAARLARQAAARRGSDVSGRHRAAVALSEQQRARRAANVRQRQTDRPADDGAASKTAEQAADSLRKGADNLQRNVDKAADQAASTAESLVDRVSQGAQSAVDSVADVIESVKKNAGSDKPAPFAFQPLTVLTATPPEETLSDNKQYQKLRLLQSVAGLDRGFAANTTAAALVESAALALAGTGEAVTLSWTPVDDEQATMQQLGGTWRLIYSSGFSSGSIGGSRPGPPAGLIPFTLGQVYQVISPYTNKLDNVVELYSKIIPPTLPGFPESKRAVLTASLKHSFEAVGGSAVQITFEDTEVRATGGPLGTLGNLPEFMIPQLPEPLRPSRQARTSTFDVLYLDNDMRITRGSRGELRIFVRT